MAPRWYARGVSPTGFNQLPARDTSGAVDPKGILQTDTRNHPSVRAGCSPGHPHPVTDQDPTRWHSRTPVAVRTPRRPHTTSARHPATRPADSSLEQWPALIHTPHASRVTHTLTPEAQSILTHHRRIGCSLSSSPPRHALCQCCASPTLLHSYRSSTGASIRPRATARQGTGSAHLSRFARSYAVPTTARQNRPSSARVPGRSTPASEPTRLLSPRHPPRSHPPPSPSL